MAYDPQELPPGQFVAVTGVNADGSAFSGQMFEAQFAPTRRAHSAWHECARCGHVDVEGAMVRHGALWYCTRFGCATEDTAR